MVCGRRGLLGVQAKVCALIVTLVGVSFAEPRYSPEVFAETEEQPGIVAYPPRDRTGPRAITVMLHGMCSEPERACRHFVSTITERGWLLCPRARKRCDGGGSIWRHQRVERDVEAGIERVKVAHPDELDERPGRTLIGFSLGAFRALDMAHGSSGEYPRVILIGAKIFPDARRLRVAGVERLLLAAGDWDMMRSHMVKRSRALVREGFPAAFQSYGPVGHAFPVNFPELLGRGLEWAEGDDGALLDR